MKEFQKGVLDNDKIISVENVQRMGEVIALCAIKTVIVRGGKDLHNLYKGLLRNINRSNDDMGRFSDGYDIAQEAMLHRLPTYGQKTRRCLCYENRQKNYDKASVFQCCRQILG